MTKKFKICVVSDSRAEYGLLRLTMDKIKDSPELELQVVVTGSHLSETFGYTYKEVENDGFVINEKIQILSSTDTSSDVVEAMSKCLVGAEQALKKLDPDLVLLHGDRYEIFSVAQAAIVIGVPVAHLGGGDIASGTYDNIFRHCITKIAG